MPTPSLTAVTSVKPIDPLLTSQLASGNNTVYTVGASKAAKLDPLVLSNVGSSAVTVQVSAVPSGGTVDGTHRVGASVALAAGDSVTYDEIRGWYPASAFISVNCSASSAIDVKLTGLEFS